MVRLALRPAAIVAACAVLLTAAPPSDPVAAHPANPAGTGEARPDAGAVPAGLPAPGGQPSGIRGDPREVLRDPADLSATLAEPPPAMPQLDQDEPALQPTDFEALDQWIDAVLAPLEDPAVVRATWDGGQEDYEAIEGLITRPLATLTDVGGDLAWFGQGCNGDPVEQDVGGRVALVARGTCTFREKILNVQSAGATALIVYTDDRGTLAMSGVGGGIDLPGVMIDREPGLALAELLTGGTAVRVEIVPSGMPADPYEATDRCVEAAMGASTPGASVAVARDGEIVYAQGYGVKHAEEGGAVDPDTMFRVASITKMMTAASVMQQVEAGTVDLEAPVQQYLPEFDIPPPWRVADIKVKHLLTHSAGLADWYAIAGPQTPDALSQWVARLSGWIIYTEPGSFYNYSNPSFNLAGAVVERVSGVPFHQYVAENVWRPAGMSLTTMLPTEVISHGNYTYGHAGTVRYRPDDYDNWEYQPAGGAFSTPTELVAWASLMMAGGGSVLSEASAAAMQEAQINAGYPTSEYGYGISVDEYRDTVVLSHGGSLPGWSGTVLLWAPEHGLAVSALHNSNNSIAAAGYCALRMFVELQRPWPPADYSTDPSTWSRYAGSYAMVNSGGLEWTARADWVGDGLRMAYPSLGALWPGWELVQAYEDTFQLGVGGTAVEFVDDKDAPGTVKWLRHRNLVGMRVGDFPSAVELRGEHCAPLEFTPQEDVAELAVRAYGLTPLEILEGLPIEQDDPDDRSSASFKRAFTTTTEVPRLSVFLRGEQDDDLDVFVLRDANEDGEFTYPDEAIAQGSGSTASETVAVSTQPAGAFEVWVHGYAVSGEGSVFTMAIDAVHGDLLRVEGGPTALTAGESYSMDVCADGAGDDAPALNGMVVFDYGYAPRYLKVPILWRPAPRLFLPLAAQGWPLR